MFCTPNFVKPDKTPLEWFFRAVLPTWTTTLDLMAMLDLIARLSGEDGLKYAGWVETGVGWCLWRLRS